MQSKKAQITIFILIGLILVISIALFLYMRTSQEVTTSEVIQPSELQPIKVYVELCLKESLKNALISIGIRGGYYEVPSPSIVSYYIEVPYYFYEESIMPGTETIQDEISNYINLALPACLYNLSQFPYETELGEISPDTTITENSVIVKLDYPITVKIGESTSIISDFYTEFLIELKKMYNISSEIIKKHMEEPEYLHLSDILKLSIDNDVEINYVHEENSTIVYTIINNNSRINNEPYFYSFAIKYDWEEGDITKAVDIEPIPEQDAYVDYLFSYTIKASGNNLTFSDFTYLFDINPETGKIEFTPSNEQGGKHLIMIKATDKEGNEDLTFFELNVLEANLVVE